MTAALWFLSVLVAFTLGVFIAALMAARGSGGDST